MTKVFFLTVILAGIGAPNADRAELLTGGGIKKSWYLYASSSENQGSSCRFSKSVSQDNTYIFYADGTFVFDNGAITEDVSCEDCCGDFVDIVGTWKFTKGEKGIRIIALHEKNNPSNTRKILLYDAVIEHLDENILKFSQENPKTRIRHIFEFRKM